MHECFGICWRVAEFTPPMSRRPVANRREPLLPLLMPDRHQIGIAFDPSVPGGPTATSNGKAGEAPAARTRHATHSRAAKQTDQTSNGVISELIANSHLLPRLMFQHIRARNHSETTSEQNCSPHALHPTLVSIASLDIPTAVGDCAEMFAQVPIPPGIEPLLTQLVRRRLRAVQHRHHNDQHEDS